MSSRLDVLLKNFEVRCFANFFSLLHCREMSATHKENSRTPNCKALHQSLYFFRYDVSTSAPTLNLLRQRATCYSGVFGSLACLDIRH
uniref:Uncharacterized protein n=1 Tax=Parascaris equorum TaxID=6256 RepID=A0A914REY0_PAREQ